MYVRIGVSDRSIGTQEVATSMVVPYRCVTLPLELILDPAAGGVS